MIAGYLAEKTLDDGRLAAVAPLFFGARLVVFSDPTGTENEW